MKVTHLEGECLVVKAQNKIQAELPSRGPKWGRQIFTRMAYGRKAPVNAGEAACGSDTKPINLEGVYEKIQAIYYCA